MFRDFLGNEIREGDRVLQAAEANGTPTLVLLEVLGIIAGDAPDEPGKLVLKRLSDSHKKLARGKSVYLSAAQYLGDAQGNPYFHVAVIGRPQGR